MKNKRNNSLPFLEDFKAEAKELRKKQNPSTSHRKALDMLSQKYGHEHYRALKPHLVSKISMDKLSSGSTKKTGILGNSYECLGVLHQPKSVSVLDATPLYPEYYVKKLIHRAEHYTDSLNTTSENFIKSLFSIDNLLEITDDTENPIVTYYDVEPRLSRLELQTICKRVDSLVLSSSFSFETSTIVRNVLNSVPRELDDLEDYLSQSSLEEINTRYLAACDIEVFEKYPPPCLQVLTKKEIPDMDELPSYLGAISMDRFQEEPISALSGLTFRQKYLDRAANFWLLHKYGFHTASLWLSGLISPSSFSYGDNPNDPRRHFGFMDTEASWRLVYSNLSKMDTFLDSDSEVLSRGKSVESILIGYPQYALEAIESLFLWDKQRLCYDEAKTLFSFVFKHKDRLFGTHKYRHCLLLSIFYDFYPSSYSEKQAAYGTENLLISNQDYIADYTANKEGVFFEKFYNCLWVSDCNNFMVSGVDRGLCAEEAVMESLYFCKAYFDSNYYLHFSNHLSGIIKDGFKYPLYEGFFSNLPLLLARRTFEHTNHIEFVADFSTRKNIHSVVSDLDSINEVMMNSINSESKGDKKAFAYWKSRLEVLQKKKKY